MTGLRWHSLLVALAFFAGLVAGLYLTTTVMETHAQSPEVADALHQAAVTYGVSESWLRRIAACESRYDVWARGRAGEQGLMQFLPSTWRWMSWQAGYGGRSPYDPYAASAVTAWALSRGWAHHWSCA